MPKGPGFLHLVFFPELLPFILSDKLIDKFGANHTKVIEASKQSGLIIPMVLAIILDGVPESIVIGLGIFQGGVVSLAMLVAVFISNLPEAIAGSIGLKASGTAGRKESCFG